MPLYVNNSPAIVGGQSNSPMVTMRTTKHDSNAAQLWAEARRSVTIGIGVLVAAFTCFCLFVMHMPPLGQERQDVLLHNFPPKNLQGLILVRDTLFDYAETHPVVVAVAILMLYIILQAFAIPGTAYLSLIVGALYGPSLGLVMVALISTLGSSACYGMSALFGAPIAHAVWKDKLDDFRGKVSDRSHDLLSYIIFLRVTPILPNTFINVASPIVGVPFRPFFIGTLLGCLPNNLMVTRAGSHLSEMESLSDLYDPRMLALGLTVGVIALAPVYLKHRADRRAAAAAAGAQSTQAVKKVQ